MNAQSYTSATAVELAEILRKKGINLADKQVGFLTKSLYNWEGEYFEITIHQHFNVVIKVKRFRGTEELEPYLSTISLADLF